MKRFTRHVCRARVAALAVLLVLVAVPQTAAVAQVETGQIAGTVPAGSSLNGLPSWLAGARSLSDAKSKCSLPPLTAGGKVLWVQYVASNLDYDYSCI